MHRFPARAIALVFAALVVVAIGGCSGSSAGTAIQKPSAAKAVAMLDARTVIDVRTPAEYAAGHVARAQNIDVEAADFGSRIATLDKKAPYLVYCHSGRRSGIAATQMAAAGFTDIVDGERWPTSWRPAPGPSRDDAGSRRLDLLGGDTRDPLPRSRLARHPHPGRRDRRVGQRGQAAHAALVHAGDQPGHDARGPRGHGRLPRRVRVVGGHRARRDRRRGAWPLSPPSCARGSGGRPTASASPAPRSPTATPRRLGSRCGTSATRPASPSSPTSPTRPSRRSPAG